MTGSDCRARNKDARGEIVGLPRCGISQGCLPTALLFWGRGTCYEWEFLVRVFLDHQGVACVYRSFSLSPRCVRGAVSSLHYNQKDCAKDCSHSVTLDIVHLCNETIATLLIILFLILVIMLFPNIGNHNIFINLIIYHLASQLTSTFSISEIITAVQKAIGGAVIPSKTTTPPKPIMLFIFGQDMVPNP